MKYFTKLYILTCLCITTISAQSVSTFTDGTPDDAIAIDSNGDIYASNFTGDTVFKFNSNGDVSSFITGLNTPNGLAFDSNDNLFVCDFSASKIFKYNISGSLLETYNVVGNPSGIIKDFNSDAMIFTIYSANTINHLATDGTITTISNHQDLNGPVGLAYSDTGVLYAGNYNDREIYEIEPSGNAIYVAKLPGAGAGPNLGFIAYSQGRIWGTILGDHKIYSVDPNALDSYVLFAGSVIGGIDGDISQATFNRPNGILADNSGDLLYVTDFGSKNLRIISDVVLASGDIDYSVNRIQLFPNPATDLINIHCILNEGEKISIDIFDISGRRIYESKIHISENELVQQIDISNWSSGTYFVVLNTDQSTISKKFVK